jgi:hypothetical protein
MIALLDFPGVHRQMRLCAVECLYLAFRINA